MDLSARSLPTALIAASPVTRITQSPGFVPVDVGTGYVVAVQAKVGTTVSGFGCAGNVAVVANEETRVPVTITDLPELLIVDGVYELDNQLDLGEGLPPSVRVGIDVLAELTDDGDVDGNVATMDYGEDPGAFVVDFAMRETCHWECMAGEDFDTCSEANHPLGDISAIYLQNFRSWSGAEPAFFGGCGAWEDAVVPAQNLVNGQISMVVPDSVTMFGVIAGDLARAISEARIGSRLTVDQPMDGMSTFIHELIDMTVVVHDLEGPRLRPRLRATRSLRLPERRPSAPRLLVERRDAHRLDRLRHGRRVARVERRHPLGDAVPRRVPDRHRRGGHVPRLRRRRRHRRRGCAHARG
jgi:hypothetical protein